LEKIQDIYYKNFFTNICLFSIVLL